MQDGLVEQLNGSFRRGVLDIPVLLKLTEVREQAELWVADCKREMRRDRLGGMTRAEFRQQDNPAVLC